MLLPNGMDGVGGVTQPHIKPKQMFVYEFELKKSGTFIYHPHSGGMVQMAMGMMSISWFTRATRHFAASTATSSSS
jgi:manganese oxidase